MGVAAGAAGRDRAATAAGQGRGRARRCRLRQTGVLRGPGGTGRAVRHPHSGQRQPGAGHRGVAPANRGHLIHNQLMDRPWSQTACCFLIARQEWYRANPIAAKRAVLRSADAQTSSRADAVKRVTDRGLFGGPANFDNVLYAASMVPANWRDLDMERSIRFYAQLMADVGLLRVSVDDIVRTIDLPDPSGAEGRATTELGETKSYADGIRPPGLRQSRRKEWEATTGSDR